MCVSMCVCAYIGCRRGVNEDRLGTSSTDGLFCFDLLRSKCFLQGETLPQHFPLVFVEDKTSLSPPPPHLRVRSVTQRAALNV